MGVLEQVTQLKGQGLSDQEVVNDLQQQGISPKEINDAINQAQIKGAVEGGNPGGVPAPGDEAPIPGANQDLYTPQTEEVGEAYAPEGAAGAEYYQEAPAGGYGAVGMDSDTIIELANQVFSEKMKKPQKTVDELNEFKSLSQVKIDNMEERLKKLEKIIDALQIQILEKVGSYGASLQSTKKEMAMMQDSFRKIAGARKTKAMPKNLTKTTTKRVTKTISKKIKK